MSKVKIIQRPSDFLEIKKCIPNIVERIDYASCHNFTGKIVPGYTSPIGLLQELALNALMKVQENLNQNNLGLIVYDAFRPHKSVEYFHKEWKLTDDIPDLKEKYYPRKTKEELFQQNFLAKKSSHSRGSTIDLSLIHLDTNKEIDMGSIFDFFDEISFTKSTKISKNAQQSRQILVGLMSKYGFQNNSNEWWHFQFIEEKYSHFYFDFDIT